MNTDAILALCAALVVAVLIHGERNRHKEKK